MRSFRPVQAWYGSVWPHGTLADSDTGRYRAGERKTLSVPVGSTKPLPTRAATDQNVQRTRGNIGFNCQFWGSAEWQDFLKQSKAWGQMLHVLMGQLRWDGLDSQDSIDEGKAVQ